MRVGGGSLFRDGNLSEKGGAVNASMDGKISIARDKGSQFRTRAGARDNKYSIDAATFRENNNFNARNSRHSMSSSQVSMGKQSIDSAASGKSLGELFLEKE